MRILLFLSLTFYSSFSFSQSFQELIHKADQLYSQEDYAQSASVFDQAFAQDSGSASQYYNAACSWALTGDTVHSMKYLTLSAERGWKNVKHAKRDPDLKTLHGVRGWDKAMAIVQANLDEYEKDLDKPLKEQLERVYVRDQTLRGLLRTVEEDYGRDSDQMKFMWEIINEQDSLNELEVEKIIQERGWVGKSVVGSQANMTLWLVIQHAPLPTQEKYLPMLQQSVKDGESAGHHLALLEDRILMRNDKPQKYGSQVQRDPETGEYRVAEIVEPEYVNQRRAEVGLGPIEDYISNWGIEWDVPQKTK